MTEALIRKKVLYSYRLLGIYSIVAIDGTGRRCANPVFRLHRPRCFEKLCP
ncbi:MAG: hypothetical protein WCO26_07840 [Deltaproteobacteria bacterium]